MDERLEELLRRMDERFQDFAKQHHKLIKRHDGMLKKRVN